MQICFATNNHNKLKEIRKALETQFQVLSLLDIGCKEDLPETGNTLENNSFQKAQYLFSRYKVACFADDTGLEVAALNNEPGVYSARYAGAYRDDEKNISLLLDNILSESNRMAQFKTVITYISTKSTEQFIGIVKGRILEKKTGIQGFGYDSIFQPIGYDRSFAEMSIEEKNSISHRGKAIKKLVSYLKQACFSP